MFVDNSWATQYCVREKVCTPDFLISFRPFYLPREFGQITVIFTYVPGPNVDAAGERIAESFNDALACNCNK